MIISKCQDCENKICPSLRTRKGVVACSGYIAPAKPQTNADRIRAMSDEELAEWICGVYDDDEDGGKFICGTLIRPYHDGSILEWLKQPAEEVDDG